MNSITLTGVISQGPSPKPLFDGRPGVKLQLNFDSRSSIVCYAIGGVAEQLLEKCKLGSELTISGRLVLDYKKNAYEIFVRRIEKSAAVQMAERERDWKSTRDFEREAAGRRSH